MQKPTKFGKKDLLLLLLVLVIATVLRLYKINSPLADFHSWRQVDTAAVARNFVNDGFDLLKPRYHDLSNIQSGKDNPQGYRMVEFPLYNALFAYIYKLFPVLPLEIYGRLISILFSLSLIGIIYYFLRREIGAAAAFFGALIYAVFPFFVFFSRVVLPETIALSFAFLSLFFLYLFSKQKNRIKNIILYSLSALCMAVGLLIKPTVIFFLISSLFLLLKKYKWNSLKQLNFYLYFLLVLTPLILWRYHIQQFPEGVPASEWLITQVNTYQGLQNIFFRPAFFRWIFYERINNLILGGFLTVFLIVGILAKHKKTFLYSIGISSLSYLLVFQGGNVQHEYYQTLILPALAIFTAIGINFFIVNTRTLLSPILTYLSVLALFVFSFFISFNTVKNYYNYSAELVNNIAPIVRDLTEKDDKIITDTSGDTTLLYLSERQGAPAPYKDFDQMKAEGYKYFITQNAEVINNLKDENKYEVVVENEKFAIFAL